jgi:hypothetical protein
MRRTIIASLVFALSVLLVSFSYAEMPKEGSTSGKAYWTGTSTSLPMGEERIQINYEGYSVAVSDTGEGLLHHASGHVVGSFLAVRGVYENDSGLICYTLPDGDQVFMTYECSGKLGGSAKGTVKYVGGTGKYIGIQGGGEFTRYSLKPPAEGVFASFSMSRTEWNLP